MEFTGKKWRCTGTIKERNSAVWWTDDYIEKPQFKMTRSYATYLREKRKAEIAHDLDILKHKLEYQQRTYGNVDDIDFQEYVYKLKEYSKAD